MRPIRTPLCVTIDMPPHGATDVAPLPSWRETNEHGVTAVFSVWEPTAQEREWIARGSNILVGVFSDPTPPVSLGLVFGRDFQRIEDPDTIVVEARA